MKGGRQDEGDQIMGDKMTGDTWLMHSGTLSKTIDP